MRVEEKVIDITVPLMKILRENGKLLNELANNKEVKGDGSVRFFIGSKQVL